MTAQRIQKVLASRGVASRRAAERLILDGLVTVNGERAVIGQLVEEGDDEIAVAGRTVDARPILTYVALNKPPGYVTSGASQEGAAVMTDLVPPVPRLFPVGRLDRDTAGLLLLTNDGTWANLVTHPRHGIEKEYMAWVRGEPSEDALRYLRSGVRLQDGTTTSAAKVDVVARRRSGAELRITVTEGKKRQIRYMMAAVGHPVLSLLRLRVGPVHLRELPTGRWRHLTVAEVEAMRTAANVGSDVRRV